jgi:hypothetical protein
MTIDYEKQFKVLADRLAREPITEQALDHRGLRHRWTVDENMGKLARANRERAIERVLDIFRGRGSAGDTTGNSPGTKWVGVQRGSRAARLRPALLDPDDQIQRSFEDTLIKQRALELVCAA